MIWDIHVHIVGASGAHKNYVSPQLAQSFGFRLLARRLGLAQDSSQQNLQYAFIRKTLAWLDGSQIDQAIFLALDAAYQLDGTREQSKTLLVTDNDFVAGLAAQHKKALFGASIHPYRKDALFELSRVVQLGACLIKWLPGAQNIQPDHPHCFPFYEALANYGLPLLCHTGTEHTLKAYPNTLNDPRRLIPALQRGVTVIAAHCGTRVFLHEKSYFQTWQEMAQEYENFYGDLGAFGIMTRLWPLQKILKNPILVSKLVYGSDFPAVTMPLSCLGQISLTRALELRSIENPFDRAVQMMKAAGVPEAVFSRAQQLLRVPVSNKDEVPLTAGGLP